MSERTRNLLSLLAILVMSAALFSLVSTRPQSEDRVASIGARIRCPVCQGESIADSPAPMARDMMDLIEDRVSRGDSDEEIVSELLASYTGAVLLDPPRRGLTWALWAAPPLALAAGVGVIAWWRRHPPAPAAVRPRSRPRLVTGGILLAAVFAAVVAVAAGSLQEREGPAAGAADLEGQDLSQVSNETMEAVIAANTDDPMINGMRLALAERYYQSGDYRAAFPHYLAVAESSGAAPAEQLTALVRLGWMAYEGNGEVETALRLFDQALAIDPASSVALYLKGTVLWCGAGDPSAAADLFASVLATPDLPEESRSAVQADLESAQSGEACR